MVLSPSHLWPDPYGDHTVQWDLRAPEMRIPDSLLNGVVFLYPTEDAAKSHAKYGGTGFILGKRVLKDGQATGLLLPYLVTNKHVAARNSWVRVNRKDGSPPDVFEIDERDWDFHPDGDDIAMTPMYLQGRLDFAKHKATFGDAIALVTPQVIEDYEIGVGDEVCMIGRFVNHQGRPGQENLPAARFGAISVMPSPIYNKACLKDQLSFAVEMRSRTGFSGSPVIIYRTPGTILQKNLKKNDFWGILGVNWGFIIDEDGENTWLNGVVPAWKVLEMFEIERIKELHADAERKAPFDKEGNAVPATAEASVEPKSDNPAHKEDFMSLLTLPPAEQLVARASS